MNRPSPAALAPLRACLVAAVAAITVSAFGVLAQAAQATRFFDSSFGGSSATAPASPANTAYGGTFGTGNGGIGDIAVNNPLENDGNGVDGWVYVVDRGNNRIQAFDADLDFQWAIGRDVVAPTVNEAQRIVVSLAGCSSACGQFKLKFGADTTTDLNFNATTAQVQAALRALPSVGAPGNANLLVTGSTGGPYVVAFVSGLAAANQSQIEVQPGTTPLVGSVNVETVVDGTGATPGDQGAVFEKCTVAVHCKTGATGSLGGEFNVAQGMDIDQETGDFYVRERNANARVQQFDASGGFVRAFGWDVVLSGPGNTGGFETCNTAAVTDVCKAGVTGENLGVGNPGQFGSITANSNGVAVGPPGAPNAGVVYVSDPFNCRVQRFAIPTSAVGAVGADVPFGAQSPAAATADNTFCSTASGTRVAPQDIAADEVGIIYATVTNGSSGGMVKRFDTVADAFLPLIGDGGVTSILGSGAATGVEIDPATDHLLVGRPGALGIMEFDLTETPAQVDNTHLVDSHIAGLGATVKALGTGRSPGRYFVSTSSSITGAGSGERVLVLDDDGVEPPAAMTIFPADDPTATTVTLSGLIDPILMSGFPTSYRFQVSKDGVTWNDVTTNQLVSGDGFTPTDPGDPIIEQVTGLEPNVLYRARIRTSRSPGAGFAFSSEILFHTDPQLPQPETRPAQHVSDVSAQLVGTLNAGGLDAEYWFEWGDDNYGNLAPALPVTLGGGIETIVGERLTGLAPESVYHFRLCARNALSPDKQCGADQSFRTRSTADSPAVGRAYEMLFSPVKPLRRGGDRGSGNVDYARLTAAAPALSVPTFRSGLFAGAIDETCGHGMTRAQSYEVRRRLAGGIWKCDAIFNVAPPTQGGAYVTGSPFGESSSLMVSAWQLLPSHFVSSDPNEELQLGIRVLDDQGGPRGGGWYPWLDHPWYSGNTNDHLGMAALADDDRIIAQPTLTNDQQWRDLTPSDDDVAPNGLVPPQTAGRAVFLGDREHDWRPVDLVNECSGAGGLATRVPSRDDNGTPSGPAGAFPNLQVSFTAGSPTITSPINTFPAGIRPGHFVTGSGIGIEDGVRVVSIDSPNQITVAPSPDVSGVFVFVTIGQNTAALADDTLGDRPCEAGSPTDVRGAVLGARGGGRLGEVGAGAMSEDGKRVFFLSPDPIVGTGQTACDARDAAIGSGTACPAQLFVRQFDDDGNPTVRWLSRPEDALFENGQHPDALGTGVAFEGASHDGRYVFFRTDAPLVQNDPNGGEDPLESASPNSWDLYRYDLGVDNNSDPASGDPASRLIRISGGPSGTADPNTNCAVAAAECTGAGSDGVNGAGNALRFVSDNGQRIYFVTSAQIPGADNAPPAASGAGNVPTGSTDQLNATTRNLYLYSAITDAYRFVGRLPFSLNSDELDACASTDGLAGAVPRVAISSRDTLERITANCIHGSGSGDAIVFETRAQLTSDDFDANFDVYLYDAAADGLVRLTAPPPGHVAYPCVKPESDDPPTAVCNGDLGFRQFLAGSLESGLFGSRQWNVAHDQDGDLTAVYFQSRLPLIAEDSNAPDAQGDGGMDVYEWRRANGSLSLVTPGDTGKSAFFAGNSLDGTDVYFWTEQRLSAWEVDEADGDVYNATTRTDLRPDPVDPPPTCEVLTGACQVGSGVPTGAPISTVGSRSAGGENATPGIRARLAIGSVGRRARTRAARSGVLPLRVRVSSAGPVTVAARARLRQSGGRARMRGIGSSLSRASGAGTLAVRLRLNEAAMRQLRSGRPLRINLVARQPGARSTGTTVLLRQEANR